MSALLLLLAMACGTPRTRSAEGELHAIPYPGDDHGPASLEEGARCTHCHVAGATEGTPSCNSCHSAYPHPDGFADGEQHGQAWLDEEGEADDDERRADAKGDDDDDDDDDGEGEGVEQEFECTDCHGEDGTRAPAGAEDATCVSCHSTFPHAAGWDEPDNHGAAVVQRGGNTACSGCHELTGTDEPMGCRACHAQYPHDDGWSDPSSHAATFRELGGGDVQGKTCGTLCHPVEPDEVRPTCHGCHDLFPHATGWPEGHIPVVQLRSAHTCLGCHEDGVEEAPDLPLTCGPGCHSEAPAR